MDIEVVSSLRQWKVTCYSLDVVCDQQVDVLEAWFSMWQYLNKKWTLQEVRFIESN